VLCAVSARRMPHTFSFLPLALAHYLLAGESYSSRKKEIPNNAEGTDKEAPGVRITDRMATASHHKIFGHHTSSVLHPFTHNSEGSEKNE